MSALRPAATRLTLQKVPVDPANMMVRLSSVMGALVLALASRLLAGVTDIVQSFRRTTLWVVPGWYDFTLPYRRTLIGPLWVTVVMVAWLGGLGLVFGHVLGSTGETYLAYLGVGVVLWSYMSSMITIGAGLFTTRDILLLSVNNPIYTYSLRHIVACLARLLMHAPVTVAALALFAPAVDRNLPMAVLGLAAVLLASFWVAPLMGLLGTRFHDLKHVLTIAMRFLFFVTPVFWRADGLGTRTWLAYANPFTHFLAVVRAPLLGEPVGATSWTTVLVVNIVGMTLTLVLHAWYHRRVVFWL